MSTDRASSSEIVPGPLSSEQLAEIGRSIATMQDEALEARERPTLDDRLEALRAARARGRAKSGALRRWAPAGGGVVAVLAVAAAWAVWLRAPSSLEFAIGPDRTPGQVGAWIAATSKSDTAVAFSDGSRLELRADARARVVETSEIGARVILERGSVGVSVVHRDATRWAVVSGPFEIRVIGTKFEAAWNAADEALTVRLDEGEVAIAAPCLREPHRLVHGESVRLSCKDVVAAADVSGSPGTTPSGAAGSPAPSADVPSAAPGEPAASAAPPPSSGGGAKAAPSGASSPSSEAAEPLAAAPSAAAEPPAAEPSFREIAKQGKPKDAFAAAEKEGLAGLFVSAPAGDLLELANLARLAGRGADARRAYLSVRDRFGGTDAAAAAAFHLGRMSFDGSGAYAEAGRWFSTYLAERPGGAFAPEATGRLMEASEKSGDHTGARQLATRYLASYPSGAHAALAKSLLAP